MKGHQNLRQLRESERENERERERQREREKDVPSHGGRFARASDSCGSCGRGCGCGTNLGTRGLHGVVLTVEKKNAIIYAHSHTRFELICAAAIYVHISISSVMWRAYTCVCA